VFRAELVVTPEQLAARRAHVAEVAGAVVGFYTLLAASGEDFELEHLFVDPARLGHGIGSRLVRHSCRVARSAGARTLVVQSDPNAAGFYRALGATLIGEIPSSIPGRMIPYFTYDLTRDAV